MNYGIGETVQHYAFCKHERCGYRIGRCIKHPGPHMPTAECRGFMTQAFARDLGIEE